MNRSGSSDPARVVVVGPVPPPLQGAAATTEAFVARLRADGPIRLCNNAIGVSGGRIGRSATKFARTWAALWGVVVGARREGRALYIALDGGLGLAYNIAVVGLARLLGYRLYLHHHSFAYLNDRSALMAALAAIAGRAATHVVLCGRMGTALASRYASAARSLVLTSAALVEVPHATTSAPAGGGVTIGFLSNLILEKGVDTVVAMVREGRRRGVDIRLVLAGRAPDRAADQFVAAAKAELGAAIEVLGGIPEEAKAAFFARLDLFVFPTRYVNEAEPRAVIEALFHGVPVLATARGCIADIIGPEAGATIAADAVFESEALDLIEGWIAAPDRREAMRQGAARRGRELAEAGRAQLETLVRRIHGKLDG